MSKASVIRETSTNTFKLINLKLEGNSLLPLHEIDVGLDAKSVLKKLKTVDKPEERKFRANAQIFLIEMTKKMTKRISSLCPTQICSLKPEFMKKKIFLCWLSTYMNATICDGDKTSHKAVQQFD